MVKYHQVVTAMEIKQGRVFRGVTLDDLGRIRTYVRDTAVIGGCDQDVVEELIVAVNEALANIVRHGYRNKPGDIGVTVVSGPDSVSVRLLDEGPGFDPTTVTSPDTTLPLEERPFGGMGVHMMRAFSDELKYRRDARGLNELILLKRLDGQGG